MPANNGEKKAKEIEKSPLTAFPQRSGKRMSILVNFMNMVLKVLAIAIRQEKEIKGIKIGKE